MDKLKEEIKKQISCTERKGAFHRVTAQDAQVVIDHLGGNLQVEQGHSMATVCYYITLLNLRRSL